MKFLRFLFSLIITAGLIWSLNNKLSLPGVGDLPPLGKLIDPFHGFWQNADQELLDFQFNREFPQLQQEVIIQYEENLIPHIFAETEYDLYFTQGYITAFHRLWQMEFMMKVAAGQVSGILGEAALEFDRMQRRKGLMYGAENSLKELGKEEGQIHFMQAYTDGVNAYIDQLSYKDYPVEYKILDYSPGKWDLIYNVLLLKYMADDLSGSDYDLQNTNAVQLLGKERFDFLFPDIPDDIEPIIPRDVKWDFDPVKVSAPDTMEIIRQFISFRPEEKEDGLGSNNWAISGVKTNSGHAILCNDPHLSFTMPSIWFAQQMKGPDVNTYGVTIPGLPGVLLGLNDSLAWGLTNAPRDQRDWYQITFKDKEREDYLYQGKWLKTQKRIELIKIKDEKTFSDTVVYTHYGPVVYDHNFKGDSSLVNYALRWTAHNPSKELLTVYHMNRAQNLQDFKTALRYFESPPQNIAVATRSGDIGLFIEGKFPLKWKEQGKFLMDGSNPVNEWAGYIPDDHDAFMINPERGFVSSANQHSFTSDYPYYYYNNTEEYFRNRRINSRLSELDNADIQDMQELQLDSYHLLATEALPVMLNSLDTLKLSEDQLEIYNNLREWDCYTKPDQVAPSLFETWWVKLEKFIWDEFDKEISLIKPNEFITINILNKYPEDSAFDIMKTPEEETINDILLKSYLAAIDSIRHWKEENNNESPEWYKFKNTRLMHMTNLEPFSRLKLRTSGNKHIVNANGPRSGASWRLVAEMGDEINAYGIYPGGQSGNPGNPAYDTFVDEWAGGQYFKINFWGNPEQNEGVFNTIILRKE